MSDNQFDQLNTGPMAQMPDGFPFTAESEIRRVQPAAALLLPGIAGLTTFDDRVAAAVLEHSRFKTHPASRVLSTGRSALTLVYGNEEEALGEATRLFSFHRDVIHGSKAGVEYNANDMDAQAWVLACVTKSIEHAKERWTRDGPLAHEQRERLWRDVRTFGTFFGIQPDIMPADVAVLDAYWEDKVHGDSLLRTPLSMDMAQDTFRYRGRVALWPVARVGQAIWITSLEPKFQKRANLNPNLTDKRIAAAVDKLMLQTYARLPETRREAAVPIYLSTVRKARSVVRNAKAIQIA